MAGRAHSGEWIVPGVGTVKLCRPAGAVIAKAAQEWPALRPRGAAHEHWDWERATKNAKDIFALIDVHRAPQVLWSSSRIQVKLERKQWYRLDFLEVHPQEIGNELGTLAMSLVARRAAELKSDGVALMATLDADRFYRALSGTPRSLEGWTVPPGLVPFVFEGEVFETLQEIADEFEGKEE